MTPAKAVPTVDAAEIEDGQPKRDGPVLIPFWQLNCMLSFNFTNGVLLASYMLLVLPLESERMDENRRSLVLSGLMCIAGITQLINPLAGLVSDRCMSSWGRRRPFVLFGGAIGIAGIWAQDLCSMTHVPFLYFIAFGCSMFALNIAYTAVVGIMPDLVPEEQTGVASGVAALNTLIGATFGFSIFYQASGSREDRLHVMYQTYATVIFVSVALTLISCNEVALQCESQSTPSPKYLDTCGATEDDDGTRSERARNARASAAAHRPPKCLSTPVKCKDIADAYYIDPVRHSDFAIVFWGRTFYYLGASIQTFFQFYLKDVVGVQDSETAIVKTAVIGQLFAAGTAIATGFLSDRIGKSRKPFIYFSCTILALGNIANCFVRNEFEVYVISGIIGCGNGIFLAMDAALALDTLPAGEEAARFMGIWGIGCFIGGSIGPVLGGPILTLCGRSRDNPSAYSYRGYAILLCMASVFFLASGAILHFIGRTGRGRYESLSFFKSLRGRIATCLTFRPFKKICSNPCAVATRQTSVKSATPAYGKTVG